MIFTEVSEMLPLKMLQIVLPFFITILEPVKPQVCQTCDQVITGRNYNYAEALQIIQDEEYLEDADFDEIRHRVGRSQSTENRSLSYCIFCCHFHKIKIKNFGTFV